jgi:hypothetical protein
LAGNSRENFALKTCILISVWPDYEWLYPVMREMLAEFWPRHPEIVCTRKIDDGRNWTKNLKSGVEAARKMGFEAAFLINEEHVPIGDCDSTYLEKTLPSQAKEIGSVYVSLFGWDNKRFCSKSPVLDFEKGMWMRLVGERDPRFHLHPAWWRLDALQACCDLVLKNGKANGSAWHFEKTCDDSDAGLPEDFRKACYQICAGVGRSQPLPKAEMKMRLARRWVANKGMSIVPLLPEGFFRKFWLKFWDFDGVMSDGSYPMVFSGILAKGRLNPAFLKFCTSNPRISEWLRRIRSEMGEVSC